MRDDVEGEVRDCTTGILVNAGCASPPSAVTSVAESFGAHTARDAKLWGVVHSESDQIMGLFDFLKRKPPPPDEGPSLHYTLAHYALRQTALADPLFYLAVLASPDAEKFISTLIESVVKEFPTASPFSADAITVHTVRISDYPCAIVEMPEPTEIAEAYFTGLVGLIDAANPPSPETKEIPARYFTLEKGAMLDGTPRTVLAEWNATLHSNYGDGPEPTVAAFAGAIEQALHPQ